MSMQSQIHNIVQFLKVTLQESGANGFALGLSGGIDSAVVANLASLAIQQLSAETTKPYELDLIILPMGNISADAEVAREVAASLNNPVRTVELGNALEAFLTALHADEDGASADAGTAKLQGNLKARMRMSAIYYAANQKGLLVLGTDNRAETFTGYFTKHGDGAADVFPISAFTKREVYEIGRFLSVPESVLSRSPSAGLWEGQTDESEMGVPYNFIDNILEGVGELNVTQYGSEMAEQYFNRLMVLHVGTEHKRQPPHVYGQE